MLSGVARRVRRRRCVKRCAPAKKQSHSGTPRPFLVGESNRAKQSLITNRPKDDKRLHSKVHRSNSGLIVVDKTGECDVLTCPR